MSNGVWEASVDKGTWVVSAGSLYASSSVSVSVPKVYTISLSIKVNSILEENSWSTIQTVVRTLNPQSYWSVGDKKAVNISGTITANYPTSYSPNYITVKSQTVYPFIIDIWSNGITFMFAKDVNNYDIAFISDEIYYSEDIYQFSMRDFWGNTGGWEGSEMRKYISGAVANSGSFYYTLPYDLRNVIRQCPNSTDNTGGKKFFAQSVTTTYDYIYLLAEYEVFGSITYSNPAEKTYNSQLPYFKAGNSVVATKRFCDTANAGGGCDWWLRSPYCNGNGYYYCCVYSGGYAGNAQARRNKGFRPCFTI